MEKQYCVYILTNKRNTVLYTGVTNDLKRRVYEHRKKIIPGFTKKYNVYKLVYFEQTKSIEVAIHREKQLKGGSRLKKIALIESINPQWRDLYEDLWIDSGNYSEKYCPFTSIRDRSDKVAVIKLLVLPYQRHLRLAVSTIPAYLTLVSQITIPEVGQELSKVKSHSRLRTGSFHRSVLPRIGIDQWDAVKEALPPVRLTRDRPLIWPSGTGLHPRWHVRMDIQIWLEKLSSEKMDKCE